MTKDKSDNEIKAHKEKPLEADGAANERNLAIGMDSLIETTTGIGMNKKHKDTSVYLGVDTKASGKTPVGLTMGYARHVKPTSICLADGREFAVGDDVCSTVQSGSCVEYAKIESLSNEFGKATIKVYSGPLLENEDLADWQRKYYFGRAAAASFSPIEGSVSAEEVEVGDRIFDGTPEGSGVVLCKYKDKEDRTRVFIEFDKQGWGSMVNIDLPFKHIPLGFKIGDRVICVNHHIQHHHGCAGIGIVRHIFRAKNDGTMRLVVEFHGTSMGVFGPPEMTYATGGWDTLKKVQ